MSGRMDVAREGWGMDVPDWIAALVKACDAASQNKVAKRLNLSAATVSQTIHNRYAGDMVRIEDRVRSIFLADTIICPALGPISSAGCLTWRDRAEELNSASPTVVRMFVACGKCSRNPREDEDSPDGQ